jgi:hypothetical protein
MAMSLVIALMALAAFAFALNDPGVRGTLVGAVAASAGSAVAFYFASQAATQAQENILNATFGTETVPDLRGMKQAAATTALGVTSFKLAINPLAAPTNVDSMISNQDPTAGTVAAKGTAVVVDF